MQIDRRRSSNQQSGEGDLPAQAPAAVGSSSPHPDLLIRTFDIQGVEDLREASHGADLKIVQLARGRFRGHLMHAQIGSLALSTGDFGPDIRARGVMNSQLLTIGMMLESSGQVSQWDYDVIPGDIVVFPKSVEQEGRFTGHSRYATITLAEEELAGFAAGEGRLQSPEFWTRIHRFRSSPQLRTSISREIAQRASALRDGAGPTAAAELDFFKRSILEAFFAGIIQEISGNGDTHSYGGAKLVRAVEDYVESVGADRPLHISEICTALLVSRRTLHRAFHDTLGVGPVAYLRLQRLCAVHRALSGQAPLTTVTEAALEHGFTDLGRFAGYYRRIFAESPSKTHRKTSSAAIPQ